MDNNTENKQIEYNDLEELRAILVGQTIIETRASDSVIYGEKVHSIEFVLDNGVVLEARETYGCSCSYGDWSVANPQKAPKQVITSVDVVDELDDKEGDSATLRMFVYAEGIKTELVRSTGSDNGYYGWGYVVFVKGIAKS